MTTTIEEIGQFNEDCSIKRCQQLKIALQQHTVQIVQVLQHFLRKDDRQNPSSLKFSRFSFIMAMSSFSFYFEQILRQ